MSDFEFELDQELLDGFLEDSYEIISSLKDDLNRFTSTKDPSCFEKFGQGIDRIMGAAFTLGFKNSGELAKLGKDIGYKASQISEVDKLLSLQSILSQLIKELEREFRKIKKADAFESAETQELLVKLNSINKSLGNLRTSVKI